MLHTFYIQGFKPSIRKAFATDDLFGGDIETLYQKALQLARRVDPKGQRTIGTFPMITVVASNHLTIFQVFLQNRTC